MFNKELKAQTRSLTKQVELLNERFKYTITSTLGHEIDQVLTAREVIRSLNGIFEQLEEIREFLGVERKLVKEVPHHHELVKNQKRKHAQTGN